MASAYNKFNAFSAAAMNKVHNLGSDQLTIALTASANAPVATNAVIADLTQISYTNLSSRNLTLTSSTQTSGLYKLILQDLLLTASGAVATFRYVVMYNSTAASGNLISWWDYGADVTLANTETFNIDLDQANGVFSFT
jgi:hypothetical protein